MLTAVVAVVVAVGLLALAIALGAGLIGAPDATAGGLERRLRRLARRRVDFWTRAAVLKPWEIIGTHAAICAEADQLTREIRAYLCAGRA
jgi:hypothetical protein